MPEVQRVSELPQQKLEQASFNLARTRIQRSALIKHNLTHPNETLRRQQYAQLRSVEEMAHLEDKELKVDARGYQETRFSQTYTTSSGEKVTEVVVMFSKLGADGQVQWLMTNGQPAAFNADLYDTRIDSQAHTVRKDRNTKTVIKIDGSGNYNGIVTLYEEPQQEARLKPNSTPSTTTDALSHITVPVEAAHAHDALQVLAQGENPATLIPKGIDADKLRARLATAESVAQKNIPINKEQLQASAVAAIQRAHQLINGDPTMAFGDDDRTNRIGEIVVDSQGKLIIPEQMKPDSKAKIAIDYLGTEVAVAYLYPGQTSVEATPPPAFANHTFDMLAGKVDGLGVVLTVPGAQEPGIKTTFYNIPGQQFKDGKPIPPYQQRLLVVQDSPPFKGSIRRRFTITDTESIADVLPAFSKLINQK